MAKLREDRRPATRSNETWAMDFVHDQLATGHKLRVLTIVDIFSRFSPALCRGSPSAAATSWRCWKGPQWQVTPHQ
ncbi:transposase InsO family protein [Bradyrhizobium sp. GM0.4]